MSLFGAGRRRALRSRLLTTLRTDPPDSTTALALTAVVEALGSQGERDLGYRTVELDRIAGSVARVGDFDRAFRPLRGHLRPRWESVAGALTGGKQLPPVQLVQLGELYFVGDGHHRVSAARALGMVSVPARVRRICTIAYACGCLTLADLPHKTAERLFLERVPLPDDVRTGLWLDDPDAWPRLADAAEAWGYRQLERGRVVPDRSALARAWWAEEVLARVRDGAPQTVIERYLAGIR